MPIEADEPGRRFRLLRYLGRLQQALEPPKHDTLAKNGHAPRATAPCAAAQHNPIRCIDFGRAVKPGS
jgi:hypothetical protein